MTDRLHALTVVLEQDIRDDDAESLMDAIRHLRGVLDVSGNVSDIQAHSIELRVRQEYQDKIWKAVFGGYDV